MTAAQPAARSATLATFAAALLLALIPASARANPIPDPNLFDGATVTDVSPMIAVYGFEEAADMFGGSNPRPFEPGHALFQDNRPTGTVHWVEFTTHTPVTLAAVRLIASHDPPYNAYRPRSISRFKLLMADNGIDVFNRVLLDAPITVPYGDHPGNDFAGDHDRGLDLTVPLGVPFTGSHFRAEFTQAAGPTWGGPRVTELMAYAVPEPATLALWLTAPALLTAIRRRART